MTGTTGHRLLIVPMPPRRRAIGTCVASCSCGWRSPPSINAGTAGGLWDLHLAGTWGTKEAVAP